MAKSRKKNFIPKRMTEQLTNIENEIKITAEKVDKHLASCLVCDDPDLKSLFDSANYSLLNGGKRIRPFIILQFSRALGGDERVALDFAAALEMVHTYSLIHDDLPCMDNDDYRRGKPSNHKAFGEATALLAGDALLTQAFSVLSSADLPSEVLIEAIKLLSYNAGIKGMIGGQVMDMSPELLKNDFERLNKMYSLKTGALIVTAAKLGCLSANITDEKVLLSAEKYAQNIGLVFQIVDDLLDKYGDEKALGKPVGSDEKNDKTTCLSFISKEEAEIKAKRLTEEAISYLENIPQSEALSSLALFLLNRKK